MLGEARRVAGELKRRLRRATVILHGSYSRGDFNLWSDVDLLVISEEFSGIPPLERIDAIQDLLPPGFEAVCLAPEEARIQLEKPWWKKALGEAVVLVDDYGIAAEEKGEREEPRSEIEGGSSRA